MGWLLLSLRTGESYGRALLAGLAERGVSIDSHHAYRILRALERDGAVTSRWTASDAGPQRRTYRLTRNGQRRLADVASTIAAGRQLHEAFLRAYEAHSKEQTPEAGPRVDRSQARLSGSGPPPAVGRELLAVWLLLLLDRGPSYGYGLRQALEAENVRADAGAMYRVLREFEREAWLESRWSRSVAGPRRRFYHLTPAGGHQLEALATATVATRDRYAAFLVAYAQPAAGRAATRSRRSPDRP
jgi:DNA-binding PadR family transcriptional regulator